VGADTRGRIARNAEKFQFSRRNEGEPFRERGGIYRVVQLTSTGSDINNSVIPNWSVRRFSPLRDRSRRGRSGRDYVAITLHKYAGVNGRALTRG